MDWLINDDEISDTKSKLLDPWNILIVDDDEQIHLITKLALSSFSFENRSLSFDSVYSGEEARIQLSSNKYYAVILLDVVMESDDAGLLLAKYIRENLKNRYSRIILRTGQPGLAPEYKVIRDYDIDYYKSKTELKKDDLESVLYTSLRSYRDISSLQIHRKSIEQVISSLTTINSATTIENFASLLLDHVGNLIGLENGKLILEPSNTFAVSKEMGRTRILSSVKNGLIIDDENLEKLDCEECELIKESFKSKKDISKYPYIIHYLETERKNQIVIAMKEKFQLNDKNLNLIKLFTTNVSLYYENLLLNEEISQSYNILVKILGGVLEDRSEFNTNFNRIGELASLLKRLIGGSINEINLIKLISPLHDIGKIFIPNNLLNKPTNLSDEERIIIKEHAIMGAKILSNTGNFILDKSAILALEHHEKWDGSGYPRNLKAEQISIDGRIMAIADVFDALVSKRAYRDPWEYKDAFNYIHMKKGTDFDPELVDLVMANKNEIIQIYTKK